MYIYTTSPILQTESNHIKFNPMLTHYHIYTYSLGNTYFVSYSDFPPLYSPLVPLDWRLSTLSLLPLARLLLLRVSGNPPVVL